MVRAIVGTLLEVGYKKLSPDSIPEIMLLKSRQAAALSVPAEGLFLWEITY
jgi:tRNA pseudouridine38-40 synthase